MKPKFIAILTVTLLFLIVLAQNAHAVTLRLFFWQISISQFVLILFAVVFGFAAGYIASEIMRMKRN
jgi:uncharacterized integral membrane protein